MSSLIKVAPSIIAIDYKNEDVLNQNIKMLEESDAEMIHIDVMDGKFVPNYTFDHNFVSNIRKKTNLLLDCHLMIESPELFVKQFAEAGADIITIHFEACKNLEKILQDIRALNCLAGVAINPETDPKKISEIVKSGLVDVVLVMSVNPGKCGQKYIEGSDEKVRFLKSLNENIKVEVDGGINAETSVPLKNAGADILVSGSFIFNAKSPKNAIKLLRG